MSAGSFKNGTRVKFLVEAEAEGIVEDYSFLTGCYEVKLVKDSCTPTKELFHLPMYLLEEFK